MGKIVKSASFHLRFAGEKRKGKTVSRLRPLLEVQGVDESGDWTFSSWMVGTLGELVRAYFKQECPIGIVLDRLEECPEECGGEHSAIRLALAYLRREFRPEALYVDGT